LIDLSIPIVSSLAAASSRDERFWDGLYPYEAPVHGRDPRLVRASGLRLIEKVNCRFAARGVELAERYLIIIFPSVSERTPRVSIAALREISMRDPHRESNNFGWLENPRTGTIIDPQASEGKGRLVGPPLFRVMNRASNKPPIIPYRAARHFQQGNQFLSSGRASSNSRFPFRIVRSNLLRGREEWRGETRLTLAAGV